MSATKLASKALNVRLPAPLHTRLKVASAKHKISIQDLVRDAVSKYLSDQRGGVA